MAKRMLKRVKNQSRSSDLQLYITQCLKDVGMEEGIRKLGSGYHSAFLGKSGRMLNVKGAKTSWLIINE